ncbi:MAG: DUF4258 domain-containing protein [Bacteroidia bacterium]|nr:DUF4258 domain-containing protein [Bacteroidia bacterium]NNC85357.1 DUF4258 domain-containing protein [Bacteroidia bacterium]
MKLGRQSKKLIVVALVALVYFIYNKFNESEIVSDNNTEVAYNYDELVYTKHALCRMDCREVRKDEIRQILELGKINNNKSDAGDRPCPTLAYEGVSNDGQHLRIIIANCSNVSKVVTAIDLDNEYNCYCD